MPTIGQLFTTLTGQPAPAVAPAAVVTPWVMNSRLVQPGGAFVARPGVSADGHAFIPDALIRGAALVIAERARFAVELPPTVTVIDVAHPAVDRLVPPVLFLVDDTMATMQALGTWWRGQANPAMRVVAITGSVGKTTTKELVAKVLSQRYKVWKSKGNYNSDIGLPLTLMDMPLDAERAVVEMGMTRLGEITELVDMMRPVHVGVVTNVGIAHAEQLGSIEAIAVAKGELPAGLPPDGLAVLNGDDPRVGAMARNTRARVFMYGMDAAFDLWADQVTSNGLKGLSFTFHRGQEEIFARVGLLGRHSVHGALAAAAVALNDGMSWQEILAALTHMADMEVLRVIVVQGVNHSTLIDDSYNASPDSVMAALNLLADLDGRKIAVLGDMRELGDYSERAHTMVARRAAEVAARFVAIGAMAPVMAAEARATGMTAGAVFATLDREEAVNWLRNELRPGDTVLVKGSRALRLDELVNQLSVDSNGDFL